MGWIEQPPSPCTHPDRPAPTMRMQGRIWECDACGARWRVEVVDYGHDVMPGEPSFEAVWRSASGFPRR